MIKACWHVTTGGRCFAMVGEPCDHAEALAFARGDFPIGVRWQNHAGKYQSRCRNPFTKKQEHLGLFTCPDAAHDAWRAKKHEHACRYAGQQTDQRIAAALLVRYARNKL